MPRVLVVDDDADIRESLAEILREERPALTVGSAAHGLEALELLDAADALPCVVLLDLMMPVMNGYDFLDALRVRNLALQVVVISAFGARGLTQEPPIVEVLQKPFELDDVLACVDRCCP